MDSVLRKLHYAEDLIHFVPMAFVACAEGREMNSAYQPERMEMMFPRYSLRMLYHARNFIRVLIEAASKAPTNVNTGESIMLQIGPEAYFEFDAFLYSARSLFEQNILASGRKYFTGERLSSFDSIAKDAYNSFIKPYLKPFRDEAVHLNGIGTSFSQTALFTRTTEGFQVTLHTTFTRGGNDLNLVEVFGELLQLSATAIHKIVVLIVGETIRRVGFPAKPEVEFKIRGSTFTFAGLLGTLPRDTQKPPE